MNPKTALNLELLDSERPLLYMSRPNFFGVSYTINPWMDGQIGNVNDRVAVEQWKHLLNVLRSLTEVRVISCKDHSLPDVVFVANAGSMLPTNNGYQFIVSKFRHPERSGEEQFFKYEFEFDGFLTLQPSSFFEGDGDLLRLRDLIVVGHGHRTDQVAINELMTLTSIDRHSFVPLKLVDPRFYHLDTCFFYHNIRNKNDYYSKDICMFYPDAFDSSSLSLLRCILDDKHIYALEVTENEALDMSCNSVGVGNTIVAHAFSDRIKHWLSSHNFNSIEVPLSEFHKAGGSAKCLTLRVPDQSYR